MTEDSDFKFGLQLGFAKGYHKITPREFSCRALGLGRCALQLNSDFQFLLFLMYESITLYINSVFYINLVATPALTDLCLLSAS